MALSEQQQPIEPDPRFALSAEEVDPNALDQPWMSTEPQLWKTSTSIGLSTEQTSS